MFFKKNKRPQTVRTAPNERIYAIGDIHGRHDLLNALLKVIIEQLQNDNNLPNKVRLILLGDIVDRGPDSLACLQTIFKLTHEYGAELILGNHEDLLLRTIGGDQQAQEIWLKFGGLETLKSLGITPPKFAEDSIDFGERVREAIPEEYIQMLQQAPLFLESGDYLFVHAGVRPGVDLDKQDDLDLYLIRDEFLQSKEWHGAMIVHGHSIVDEVTICENRIAVDTAAYKSGHLSCIILEGQRQDTLSTNKNMKSIKTNLKTQRPNVPLFAKGFSPA